MKTLEQGMKELRTLVYVGDLSEAEAMVLVCNVTPAGNVSPQNIVTCIQEECDRIGASFVMEKILTGEWREWNGLAAAPAVENGGSQKNRAAQAKEVL